MAVLSVTQVNNPVYELLRTQIIKLELEPGSMLSENSLASLYQVSRNVVRDALAQLTEEGYVIVIPKKGTFVTKISLSKVRQSVYSHSVLEQAIIREICENGYYDAVHSQIEDLLDSTAKYNGQEDPLVLLIADAQIRYVFFETCKKSHIIQMYRTLDSDLNRVEYLQYSTFNYQVYMSSLKSWEHTRVEGKLLLQNIQQGDVEAACLLCSNHYNSVLWRADSLRGIYPQYFTD